MAKTVPVWSAVIDAEGRLRLDAGTLFKAFCGRMKGKRVRLTVKPEASSKSRSQLGFLFGVVYPVIADELGYRDYEVEQVHDAIMRELRGLKPEPNPLQLRHSLAEMSHEEVSAYIEDVRHWAVTEYGIVTPDANKAEAA